MRDYPHLTDAERELRARNLAAIARQSTPEGEAERAERLRRAEERAEAARLKSRQRHERRAAQEAAQAGDDVPVADVAPASPAPVTASPAGEADGIATNPRRRGGRRERERREFLALSMAEQQARLYADA